MLMMIVGHRCEAIFRLSDEITLAHNQINRFGSGISEGG